MISNGLEIGRRALEAHKYAMDVIGNNIANVNTPGYSRQRVNLDATAPLLIPVLSNGNPLASLGTGVKVSQIERLRNDFLDLQARDLSRSSGTWTQAAQNLGIMESTFNEPSTTGLATRLDGYFSAWQSVASPDPSSAGARGTLISQGQLLANTLSSTRQSLTDLQNNNDKDIVAKVQRINDIADQIASYNGQIIANKAAGDANDLMDKRNVLVGELSKLVNFEYYTDAQGGATIAIGGSFLVSNLDTSHLSVAQNVNNHGFNDVIWKDTTKSVPITAGELYGLLQSRDVKAADYIAGLDSIAQSLKTEINNVHRTGFGLNGDTGLDFFTGTDASNLAVNTELVYDPSKVAASSRSTDVAGNGENATAMANVRNNGVLDSGTAPIESFYQNLISKLATETSQANTNLATNKALTQQNDKQINSVSGVSIDEEMSEMIKSEHAYGAAAKYISVIQTTLDQLMAIIR